MPEIETEATDVVYEDNKESSSGFFEGVIFGCILSLALGFGLNGIHLEKQTGPFTVVAGSPYTGYIMRRPNNEVFMMKFDDSALTFPTGARIDDLTYTDVNANTRHFVKAVAR